MNIEEREGGRDIYIKEVNKYIFADTNVKQNVSHFICFHSAMLEVSILDGPLHQEY